MRSYIRKLERVELVGLLPIRRHFGKINLEGCGAASGGCEIHWYITLLCASENTCGEGSLEGGISKPRVKPDCILHVNIFPLKERGRVVGSFKADKPLWEGSWRGRGKVRDALVSRRGSSCGQAGGGSPGTGRWRCREIREGMAADRTGTTIPCKLHSVNMCGSFCERTACSFFKCDLVLVLSNQKPTGE